MRNVIITKFTNFSKLPDSLSSSLKDKLKNYKSFKFNFITGDIICAIDLNNVFLRSH